MRKLLQMHWLRPPPIRLLPTPRLLQMLPPRRPSKMPLTMLQRLPPHKLQQMLLRKKRGEGVL